MLELVILLLGSIITARLLEKNHKVAYIAHSVFFIFVLAIFFFTTDIPFIKSLMSSWLGENYYKIIYESFHETVFFARMGVSSVVIIEVVVFVLIPLLSIAAFIQEIRDQFKELKLRKFDASCFIKTFIKLVNDPEKDFRHTQNETYLILGKLLN